MSKWLYDAKKAQEHYDKALSESRLSIELSETELDALDKIISPLFKQGQSVRYICKSKVAAIMLSEFS